jgi:hypothetical protein
MNISPLTLLIAGGAVLFVVVVLGLLLKLYKTTTDLSKSFAKLGYVNREDAKKYFSEAAEKVVEMNTNVYQQNQKLIEDGMRKALADSGQAMEGALAKSQQDAGAVVVKAQSSAQQIILTAQRDSEQYFDRSLSNAVSAIEWTLEQYTKKHLDVHQHQEVIDALLEEYINERRS